MIGDVVELGRNQTTIDVQFSDQHELAIIDEASSRALGVDRTFLASRAIPVAGPKLSPTPVITAIWRVSRCM